ncbi:uncharacterized protein EI90DRAFT_3043137 [Cantharellus anzutake]|uniref:uncharacterized protein n=1 Tax=Cantharellus anzutake TaxID=1750568 RepID=UPI001906F3CC|nr:uncharacterized protein EI90DRAFT_3043137 [Cantharellus anzutake]KAF8337486.1 hypothetical protein EI90DRAFT_3043137 [Cantharellus anzutake]
MKVLVAGSRFFFSFFSFLGALTDMRLSMYWRNWAEISVLQCVPEMKRSANPLDACSVANRSGHACSFFQNYCDSSGRSRATKGSQFSSNEAHPSALLPHLSIFNIHATTSLALSHVGVQYFTGVN